MTNIKAIKEIVKAIILIIIIFIEAFILIVRLSHNCSGGVPRQNLCAQAYSCDETIDENGIAECKYLDENNVEQKVKCVVDR